jgi:hypothetical protein
LPCTEINSNHGSASQSFTELYCFLSLSAGIAIISLLSGACGSLEVKALLTTSLVALASIWALCCISTRTHLCRLIYKTKLVWGKQTQQKRQGIGLSELSTGTYQLKSVVFACEVKQKPLH